jgi:hypothetical protein
MNFGLHGFVNALVDMEGDHLLICYAQLGIRQKRADSIFTS